MLQARGRRNLPGGGLAHLSEKAQEDLDVQKAQFDAASDHEASDETVVVSDIVLTGAAGMSAIETHDQRHTPTGGAWSALVAVASPKYDEAALLTLARFFGSPILQAMRHNDFDGLAPDADVLRALRRTFALEEPPHAFDFKPHSWTSFREPQITSGLAHFLEGGPDRGRPRIRAFLQSAFRTGGSDVLAERLGTDRFRNARAKAEEARVDLVVEATLFDGHRTGLVVEAKFEHHLTRGQLPAARRHALSRGLDIHNAAFLVVLPDTALVGTSVFSKAGNKHWRAVSWWDLLLDFERNLDPATDDDQFRAFRRTIWSHSYE